MNLSHQNPTRVLLTGVIYLLLAIVLISCGTVEPTTSPSPSEPPVPLATSAAEAPPATSEADSEQDGGGILRPPVTPAPTLTPGVVAEMISDFTEAQGLEEKTIFGIQVESWLNLGLSIFQVIVIGFLLSRLLYFVLMKVAAKTEIKYDEIFLRRIRSQIFVIMVVFGFQVGTMRLPFIDVYLKQWLNRGFIAIVVIEVTVIIWRLMDVVVEWIRTDVEPKSEDKQVDSILILFHRFGRVVLVTISLIMLLSLYSINVNALVAALGVGGLAISLAAQDSLGNIISGIMIMVDQPFRVGDRIEIERLGTWGDVIDIGLRSTRIRTRDNRMVIVPNNILSTNQVVNYSYPDPHYRIQLEIGIAYGQDIEKIRKIIVDTVRQIPGVLPDKPVDALYVEMGEIAMTFRVRWWIESYKDTRHMFDLVNTALQAAFGEAGIELAVNTLDINIVEDPSKKSDESQPDRKKL